MYTLNFLANTLLLSGVEIGTHFYWEIGDFSLHGQVFLVSWFVIMLLLGASFLGTQSISQIPESWQNFMETVVEFTSDIAKGQLGESFYRPWVPFIITLFLFIFGCNWAGAIVPWK